MAGTGQPEETRRFGIRRREFLGTSATVALAALVPGLVGSGCSGSRARTRPFLYVSSVGGPSVSVEALREQVGSGHQKRLWESILRQADIDANADLLLPDSAVPGRTPATIEQRNLDFYICDAVGQRMKRLALAHLVTGDPAYVDPALAQLDVILDDDRWPDWIDQAHIQFGHPAGLRTGMLSYDAGLTYDWLFESLTPQQRARIVAGVDRRGIEPFRVSIEQDPWWLRDLNNWTTTIVGGAAVAAMAMHEAISDADDIVDFAVQTFDRYLDIYGPEGEFNESPAYANATLRPVEFFKALDDYQRDSGVEPRLGSFPFPQTCRWLQYLTLPSGYTAAFGDSRPTRKPWIKHIAAIASASNDGVLQQFYLQHAGEGDAVELLWFDGTLQPVSAENRLPLGRHFPAHGGCFSVRESWATKPGQTVLYGKTGREENHEHHDAGQLCIDVGSERMIIDLGSPSGYPADFFEAERWQYYNASVAGHNVLQFGGREMRVPDWERGDGRPSGLPELSGRMVESVFDDEWGATMLMDLTAAYEGVERVRRAVVLVYPGIVAVCDHADLNEPDVSVLRWHTIDRCEPDSQGRFVVVGEEARLSCRVLSLTGSGRPSITRDQHEYHAPFDKSRTGEPLDNRRESYIRVEQRAKSVRLLTAVATLGRDGLAPLWSRDGEDRLTLQREDGRWQVEFSDGALTVVSPNGSRHSQLIAAG